MKNLKNKKGITLVEVIVVLVIMAILAGVLVGVYTGYINRAKEKADMLEARSALLAITTVYYEEYAAGKVGADGNKIGGDPADTSKGTNWYTSAKTTVEGLCALPTGAEISAVQFKDGTVASFTYKASSGNTYNYTAAKGFVKA